MTREEAAHVGRHILVVVGAVLDPLLARVERRIGRKVVK